MASANVKVLVVAGGGGGASGFLNSRAAGGGGGGGVTYDPIHAVSNGSYTVTVGSGGLAYMDLRIQLQDRILYLIPSPLLEEDLELDLEALLIFLLLQEEAEEVVIHLALHIILETQEQ